jgi:FixJ family two-component response regulator
MIAARALISIVDDDDSVRESLPDLLREFGFAAEAFASAEAFLQSKALALTQGLILDISMPGMSGPELHRELRRRNIDIPVVFITADGNGDVRRSMLAAGAVECLAKPFCPEDLLRALTLALSGA